jgi:hypothetical protein
MMIVNRYKWPEANINWVPASITDFLEIGNKTTDAATAIQLLTDQIVQIAPALEAYASVLQEITKARAYTNTHPKLKLVDCYGIKTRYDIMMHHNGFDWSLTHESTAADRINYLYVLARILISQNRQDELTHYINSINKSAKLRLYETCLGKLAHDGGKYHWKYTEWSVLQNAIFYIRPDMRMGIKLADNAGYKKNYAPGRYNHAIMEAEFLVLANVLGLEFAKDTNFHAELIFTPASTEKLIAANLHLDKNYFAKLLQAKNRHSVFRQGYADLGFFKIPRDLVDMITQLSHPEKHTGLRPADLIAARNIGWTGSYANKLK